MDVFSCLPPELVAEILAYLISEELVNCLHVSSAWRHVVSSFRGLWTRRCLEYGLPEYYLQADDLVALFLSARRQIHCISVCKHKVFPNVRSSVVDGASGAAYDGVNPRQILHADNGILIIVMFGPRDREVQEQADATTEKDGGGFYKVSEAGLPLTPYKELKQRYQFEYILIERLNATTGRVEELCRVALEDKWKWPVVTHATVADDHSHQNWVVFRIKETWTETAWYKILLPSNTPTEQHSLQPPDFSSLHHPSNPYHASCCSKCSTIAMVKNKLSMRPPWECHIDMLHISDPPSQQVKQYTIPILNYDRLRLSSDVHSNVVFRPRFFSQQSSAVDRVCTSHKLILWRINDHVITVHDYSEEEGISSEPIATFTPAPQGKTLELSTAWGHARMELSSDSRLLGFLMARYLHVWSLTTYEKLHTVFLEGIPGLRSWILALGHVYSLFGTLHELGEVVLVMTQTGEVVWRCGSFLKPQFGSIVGHREFDGVVHEDWMSDVDKLCPIDTPLLLYKGLDQPISGLAFTT